MSAEQGLVVTEIREQESEMGGEEKMLQTPLNDIEKAKTQVQEKVHPKETDDKQVEEEAEQKENNSAQNVPPEKTVKVSQEPQISSLPEKVADTEMPVPVPVFAVPEIAETIPLKLPKAVPENFQEAIPQKAPEVAEVVPENVQEAVQEAVPQKAPEVAEVVLENANEAVPQKAPEVAKVIPENVQEAVPWSEVAKAIPENVQEAVPQKMPEIAQAIPENVQEAVPQKVSEVPEKVIEVAEPVSKVIEAVPDVVPEVVPGVVPEVTEAVPQKEPEVTESVQVLSGLVPEVTQSESAATEQNTASVSDQLPEAWKSALEVPELEVVPQIETNQRNIAEVVPATVEVVQQEYEVTGGPAPPVKQEELKQEIVESIFVKAESVEVEGESVPISVVLQDETDLSFHDANEEPQAMTDDEFQEVESNGVQAHSVQITPLESNKEEEGEGEEEGSVLQQESVAAVGAMMEDIFTTVKQFSAQNEQQGGSTSAEVETEMGVDQIIKEQEKVSQKFIEENIPALLQVPEPVEVKQPPTEEVREDIYVSEFMQSGDTPDAHKTGGTIIEEEVKVEDVQPEITEKQIEPIAEASKQQEPIAEVAKLQEEDTESTKLAVSGLVYEIFDSVESHAATVLVSEEQVQATVGVSEEQVQEKQVEEIEGEYVIVQKLSQQEQAAAAKEAAVVVETVEDGKGDVHVKEMVDDMFVKLSTGSPQAAAMEEVYENVIRQETCAPTEKASAELDTAKVEGGDSKEADNQQLSDKQQLEMRDSVDEIHMAKISEGQLKGRAVIRTVSGRIIEAVKSSFTRRQSDVKVESSGDPTVGVSQGSIETETGSEEIEKMSCQCFPFFGKRKNN